MQSLLDCFFPRRCGVRLAAVVMAAGLLGSALPVVAGDAAPDPWSGLYGGAHGGYGWGKADYEIDIEGFFNERMNHDLDHGVAGGQLGFQRQFGHIVAGVEVTYTWLNQSDTRESEVVFGRIRNIEIDQLFTATGRLGYAHGDYLAYVKGGYAGSDVDTSIHRVDSDNPPSTTSGWVNGWVIGGGIEHLCTPWLVLGVEYDYVSLDMKDRGDVLFDNKAFNYYDASVDVQTVTARVSFKLNHDPAPPPPLK
jgi:opacity protein-like surface antigen